MSTLWVCRIYSIDLVELFPQSTYVDQKALSILGQRIRKRRIASGLTQEKLAFAANLDRSHLANIELGKNNPSFLILCHVCHVLDCDLDELTQGLPRIANEGP